MIESSETDATQASQQQQALLLAYYYVVSNCIVQKLVLGGQTEQANKSKLNQNSI